MADPAAGQTQAPYSPTRIALLVLLPFGIGYYLSYLYRTVNVVIAEPLSADLSLSAADLGMLTSIYFLVFAAFQTPLGVLLDRYGPRRVQVVLLVFAVAGSLLFAVGDSLAQLAVGRGLIGLGVSGSLMAALKANAMWFPRQRLPLVNGCATAFGSFGALSATVPVERLFEALGWRPIFLILAALTVAAIALIWFCVPERPSDAAGYTRGRGGLAGQFRDLGLIYTSAFFWRVGLVTVVHNAVYLAYQSLWLGPWLRDVAGMSLSGIAQTMLWFNVGMFVGVLGIGAIADRLQSVGVRPIHVMGTGIAASIAMQMTFALEQTAMVGLQCLAFGFFGSSALLVYSILGQEFPVRLVGRVNTAANMLSFAGIFAVQWGVGLIINQWPEAGGGRYDPAGHQAALFAVIALQVVAYIWFLVARHQGSGVPR